jgi:hypothetical protein
MGILQDDLWRKQKGHRLAGAPNASVQKLPKRCFDEGALFPIMWMMWMMFSL